MHVHSVSLGEMQNSVPKKQKKTLPLHFSNSWSPHTQIQFQVLGMGNKEKDQARAASRGEDSDSAQRDGSSSLKATVFEHAAARVVLRQEQSLSSSKGGQGRS